MLLSKPEPRFSSLASSVDGGDGRRRPRATCIIHGVKGRGPRALSIHAIRHACIYRPSMHADLESTYLLPCAFMHVTLRARSALAACLLSLSLFTSDQIR